MAQVVRFWAVKIPSDSDFAPTLRLAPSVKWHRSVKIYLSRAWDTQQQYEVHTAVVRVAIRITNTTTPRCTNAVAAPLRGKTTNTVVVERRGLGPRDQEDQRTQRASFVATRHTRVRSNQQQ